MNSDIFEARGREPRGKGKRLVIVVIVLPFIVFWGRLLLSLPWLLRSKALACKREAGPCTDGTTEALYELKKERTKGARKIIEYVGSSDRQPGAEHGM